MHENTTISPKAALDMKESSQLPVIFFLLIQPLLSAAVDTLHTNAALRDDGDSLISPNGVFQLGFFSPKNSTNRYIGLWYTNIPDQIPLWVANRESPVTDTSGALTVTLAGALALLNGANGTVWSTNTTSFRNITAQLLNSGNLVVKDEDDDDARVLWQSFDHPTDTLLPGIALGRNYVTQVETFASSWRSDGDPAPGEYSWHVDPTGYPQIVVKKGSDIKYRIGPWNGLRFSGAPDTSKDPTYYLSLEISRDELRYTEGVIDHSVISRSRLNPNGQGEQSTWNNRTKTWITYHTLPADNCDTYALCGAHASCNVGTSPSCECLNRFVPKTSENWGKTDWSEGCVRRAALSCEGDKFLKYSGIKLPDARNSTTDSGRRSIRECESECSRDCSCTAFTQLNISGGGSGCLFYHGDLVDIRTMSSAGQDLYIRLASSEDVASYNEGRRRAIIITSVVGVVVVCLIIIFVYTWMRNKDSRMRKGLFSGCHAKVAELPFFSLSTVLKAVDGFSIEKKLGEGGFGPVYRGVLEDGQEIAVKRLSKTSSQGVDELRNEVILISKLQHRNLVRTLGFCDEGKENMLIYEYMPNHSLDLMLFDEEKSRLLEWRKRFDIIKGIAKALLYLHQDSRLRIIHRDLKASNILLDADMNPKVSDFGLARSFGGNETEARTRRVVGTYGYMSPEYAIDGLFSIKSDVFSFGVLVLEIVSGKRNRGFVLGDHNLNLLGHAWTLYKEGRSRKLMDPRLGEAFDVSEVVRSIHVGLLCVQKSAEDRPSMSEVVFMIGNDVALPEAKQPGFFTEREIPVDHDGISPNPSPSHNLVTITKLEGR